MLKTGGNAALFEGQAKTDGMLSFEKEEGGTLYSISTVTELGDWLAGEGQRRKYLCIADPEGFQRLLTEAERNGKNICRSLEEACLEGMQILSIFQTGQEMSLCAGWLYEKHKASSCGIHLGGNAGSQRLLSFPDLSYSRLNQRERAGTGYLTKDGHTVIVRLPQEIREEKDDSGRGTGAGVEPALRF